MIYFFLFLSNPAVGPIRLSVKPSSTGDIQGRGDHYLRAWMSDESPKWALHENDPILLNETLPYLVIFLYKLTIKKEYIRLSDNKGETTKLISDRWDKVFMMMMIGKLRVISLSFCCV